MNLNIPHIVSRANYSELEKELMLSHATRIGSYFVANLCYLDAQVIQPQRIEIAFLKKGSLGLNEAGLVLDTNASTNLEYAIFAPREKILKYSTNGKKFRPTPISWNQIQDGFKRVIIMPREISYREMMSEHLSEMIKKIGDGFTNYNQNQIDDALDNAFGTLN